MKNKKVTDNKKSKLKVSRKTISNLKGDEMKGGKVLGGLAGAANAYTNARLGACSAGCL